jgi:DNA mismatch repair ATPase MutS
MGIIITGSFVFLAAVLSLFIQRKKRDKKLKQLRNSWGKIPENIRDEASVKMFFELNKTPLLDHTYTIDENTWYDLNFDKIFSLIDRSSTPCGAQYLFYLLRHPVFKKEILDKREKLITDFSTNPGLREEIQLAIQRLEDENSKYLPYSLWKTLPDKPSYAKIFPVISFVSILLLLLVLFQLIHYGILIVVFTINLIIRFYEKRKIDVYIYSFQYLGILISAAEKISSLKFNELKDIREVLLKNLEETRIIAKKIFTLQFKDELGLIEYLNIYFMWDISGFYSAVNRIKKHIGKLKKIYETVGYLDALISVASFRSNYKTFCRPLFNEENTNYILTDIYNPLLTKPVTNTFEFNNKNIIITGSNMAGKTTFLKTVGVNALLAQTINTCLAKSYKAPFVKVISSISREDNLVKGKSYYLAEVESIQRLIKASKTNIIHLFILDEIFRGTNSSERLAISIEVLYYLANGKDFNLVATHDLQLCEKLKRIYSNYHFREKVCDHGLSFNYKIYPGIATTKNAIALLKYVGYPKSIVEKAYNRINNNEI